MIRLFFGAISFKYFFCSQLTSKSFFDYQAKFNGNNVRERFNRTKRKFDNIISNNRPSNNDNQTPTNNPKAIHNGTQTMVPPETTILLSLGPKFAVPMNEPKQVPFYHLMAEMEQIIATNSDTTVQDRTRCAVPM